jgi:hypothetical protein
MAVTVGFGHHQDRAPTHGYEATRETSPIGATSRNALELCQMLVTKGARRLLQVLYASLSLQDWSLG